MAASLGHAEAPCHSSHSSHGWTFFLWALWTLSSQAWGFNLDTTHTLHKLGDGGTFFGFSLALHQQISPEPQSWWVTAARPSCLWHNISFKHLLLHPVTRLNGHRAPALYSVLLPLLSLSTLKWNLSSAASTALLCGTSLCLITVTSITGCGTPSISSMSYRTMICSMWSGWEQVCWISCQAINSGQKRNGFRDFLRFLFPELCWCPDAAFTQGECRSWQPVRLCNRCLFYHFY